MRIFISYGRDEHNELACRLKEDLKARGHEVWFDEDCLRPGFDWEYYIEEGLQWCATEPRDGRVVLLMTPHAIRRPDGYCLNEIARALYRGLLVVPVMVVWCEPPLSICRIQWLDMQDCIPVAENPERYELKRNLLIQALEEGKVDFEATQSALFHHLQPLDFSADIAQHVQNFAGRKWIFDRIDTWLDTPNALRIFWINGSPGVGKTAIASYLCHKRREVVAFHLCRHGHDDKSDPKRCVLSLAYQLSSQFPEYREHIALLLGDLNKSAATLFDNLIVQPLARQSYPPGHPLLIVIDGLDEATNHGTNELAEFIAKEFPRTPLWLRLLITSRPEPEVVQPLQALSPYYLDAGSPENLNDIRTYLREFLPLSLPSYTIDDQTINAILEKSEGIFLYVKTVINELKEGRLSLDQVNEFPQGLGGEFFRFFTRRFPDVISYQQRHRPFLEMIMAARGPLPLKLAQGVLRWSSYDYQVNENGEASGEALSPLGSLFPYTGDHIRPFHQSIIDWLTNPAKAGPYFIDIKEGHKRMAKVCWGEYKNDSHTMSAYTLTHLPTHLIEVERWEDLLELVKDPKVGFVTKWVEGGKGDEGLPCLIGLINYLERHGRDPVTSAGLGTQVARIYSHWGQYEDAERYLMNALGKTSWIRGRRVHVIALHELGSLYLYRGNFDQSARQYSKALRLCLWGKPIYHDEAAGNLIGLGTIYLSKYLFQKTIRIAQKALEESKKSGDVRHIVAAERLIASAYKYLGRYSDAELHIKSALLLCDQFKIYLEKLRLLLLQGWLQYDLSTLNKGLPGEALRYFQQAHEEAKKLYDLYCVLEAKIGMAWCALDEKETSKAVSWLEEIKRIFPLGRHPELRAGFEIGSAAVAQQQGDLISSQKLYQESISFCNQHNISSWKCRALIGLGSVFWHLGNVKESQKNWNQALETGEKISIAKKTLVQISIDLSKTNFLITPK